MEKGLLCWIYTNKQFGDCSCNGISARFQKVVVLNNPEFPEVQVPEIFEPSEDAPAVRIGQAGRKFHVYCVESKEINKRWTMCGGSYVATSDGRWPFEGPVSLHDRVEG